MGGASFIRAPFFYIFVFSVSILSAQAAKKDDCLHSLQADSHLSRPWIKSQLTASDQKGVGERRLEAAIQEGGFEAVSLNPEILAAHQSQYTYEIKYPFLADDPYVEIGWIFSGLSLIRNSLMQTGQFPKNFELSENYILFYTLLERSNRFLERLIERTFIPLRSDRLQTFTSPGVHADGWFTAFYSVVMKYGVVPRSAMRETAISYNRDALLEKINEVLGSFSLIFLEARDKIAKKRKASPSGELTDIFETRKRNELLKEKNKTLTAVWAILEAALGTPPSSRVSLQKTFIQRMGEFKKELERDEDAEAKETQSSPEIATMTESHDELMSAEDLLEKSKFLDEIWVMVANYPNKAYDRLFEIKSSVTVFELIKNWEMPVQFLNLPAERLEALMAKALQEGQVVPLDADFTRDADFTSGILHPEIFQSEGLFNGRVDFTKLPKTKAELNRVMLGFPTHSVIVRSLDQPEATAPNVKYKVQATRSSQVGDKGYFHMYREWMLKNGYHIVIPKRLLSEAEQKVLDRAPIKVETEQLFRP